MFTESPACRIADDATRDQPSDLYDHRCMSFRRSDWGTLLRLLSSLAAASSAEWNWPFGVDGEHLAADQGALQYGHRTATGRC